MGEAEMVGSSSRGIADPKAVYSFPLRRRLRTPEEVRDYFSGDEVVCLICGSSFSRLPRHLAAVHHISADEYKRRFGLPWGRGLISEAHRQKLASILAEQPPRPVPDGRYQRRKRPRQPFEQVISFRALERATPKRPNNRAAHEDFLRRVRSGRTVRSVARDPDMPSLAAHYAYRKAHPHYDRRMRQAIGRGDREP